MTLGQIMTLNDTIDWGYHQSFVLAECRWLFPFLDDLLYLVGNTVLPIKNLEVNPFDGVISFGTTRTFFNRRWNATRGRWFMFFNSLTQLPADAGIRTLLATKPIYAARAFLNTNRIFISDEEFPEGDVGPKRSNNTVELEHYMYL